MSALPLALVFGGTGNTAVTVVNGLVDSGNFRVATAVRPASTSKPIVSEYRKKGVEIREAEIDDSVEKLTEVLSGVDVLISTVTAEKLLEQRGLFEAAKKAGVKRVVPCDFGTPGKRGIRTLLDTKIEIHEYIKSLGLNFTFIDIGWWMQITVPFSIHSKSPIAHMSYEIHGDGKKKNLVTNLENVGKWVARIVADERTLNRSVIIWDDEITWQEAKEIGVKASGEGEDMRKKLVYVPEQEILARAKKGKEEYARTKSFQAHMMEAWNEYQYSMHILGENSLENAKALGYLDAHELYPDIKQQKFEEWAPTFYKAAEATYY